MMEEPLIDVFLTTHNHVDLTIRCLYALYAFTRKPFRLTIIDDSTDETVSYLERFVKEHDNVQVIRPEEQIMSFWQALNYALEKTDCPIICVMVNSVTVEPNWLDAAYNIITLICHEKNVQLRVAEAQQKLENLLLEMHQKVWKKQ